MREIVIDEISTFSALHLDVLYNAFREVSWERPGIKLTVVGDFCQLPPTPDPGSPGTERYAFEAECWRPNFSENTTRYTKIWRQEHEAFIGALRAARRGAGEEALGHLHAAGVRFEPGLNHRFEGTTLIPINDDVDVYNMRRLREAPGDNASIITELSIRWAVDGPEPGEWRTIPTRFDCKPGVYVMILSNDAPTFRWVNGDCGTVLGREGDQFVVRLKRNDSEVSIGKITRPHTTRRRPAGVAEADMIVLNNKAEYDEMVRENGAPPRQVVMLRERGPEWITGWIRYYPLRLAYATTVHKSQGLSLDTVQLDLSPAFLASPAMMYVALSRCRTPEGLVLVGTPEQVVAKTRIDPRVTEWL
jgi:ATP-dependent DNA helicase PIF1